MSTSSSSPTTSERHNVIMFPVYFGIAFLILFVAWIGGQIMAGIAELDASIARLEAAVDRIVPPSVPDLSAEIARIDAASAKVEAAFPPPPAP